VVSSPPRVICVLRRRGQLELPHARRPGCPAVIFIGVLPQGHAPLSLDLERKHLDGICGHASGTGRLDRNRRNVLARTPTTAATQLRVATSVLVRGAADPYITAGVAIDRAYDDGRLARWLEARPGLSSTGTPSRATSWVGSSSRRRLAGPRRAENAERQRLPLGEIEVRLNARDGRCCRSSNASVFACSWIALDSMSSRISRARTRAATGRRRHHAVLRPGPAAGSVRRVCMVVRRVNGVSFSASRRSTRAAPIGCPRRHPSRRADPGSARPGNGGGDRARDRGPPFPRAIAYRAESERPGRRSSTPSRSS